MAVSGSGITVSALQPAFTAVIAYLLLGERFTGVQIAGGLLILGGVLLLRIYEGRRALLGRSGSGLPAAGEAAGDSEPYPENPPVL